MLEADDLTAAIKKAEAELAAEQKAVDADRQTRCGRKSTALKASLDRITRERVALVASLDRQGADAFRDGGQRKRNGVAVAEARDGVCTICHVRLRPQVFNTVRRNEQIIQCDHCNRILYFTPVAPATADTRPVTRRRT